MEDMYWYILCPFGLFYGHLLYVVAIILVIGYIFPVLVCCTKKNLAALPSATDNCLNHSGPYDKHGRRLGHIHMSLLCSWTQCSRGSMLWSLFGRQNFRSS
jgi:hypothetical protein